MKNILLLACLFFATSSFAQTYRFIDAPIGFLRDEPKVTANILIKLNEKARVKVIEQISRTWSKVEYTHNAKAHIGYITNHTLSDESIIRKRKI